MLAQQRSRIEVLVAQTELLTKSEVAAAETQRKVKSDQEALLTAAQAERTALLQKRLDLLEQQSKLTNDKRSGIDLLTLDINDKQKQANDKGLQVAALRAKLLEGKHSVDPYAILQAVALGGEDGSEVLPQWVEPDVLDGEDLLVDTGFLAAADGLADVDPVGGLVGRAAVALALDEGLQQHGLEAVAPLPVKG